MSKNKIFYIIIAFVLVFSFTNFAMATNQVEKTEVIGGALTMTPEEFEIFRENNSGVSEVRLNEKAIAVLQDPNNDGYVNLDLIEPVEFGKEIVTDSEASLERNSGAKEKSLIVPYSLPTRYDVSLNNTFPPIQDQGNGYLTCGAWAYGYYQATNNMANVRGYNAKTTAGGNDPTKYRIHPQWQYTLINGGAHNATHSFDNLNALTSYGALSWYDYTQANLGTSDSTWHPGAALWEKALNNKFESYTHLWINTPANIEKMKDYLINGYVSSFYTEYSGYHLPNWYTIASKTAPGTSSPAGQQICYFVEAAPFGHFMTIVGYDDDIWADVNNNGIVDPGEKGAFKIANSEGTGFKNSGYVWLLYDALNATSGIPGVPTQSARVEAVYGKFTYFLKPKTEYSPLLLAEVTLNTARRNQIGLEIGISPTSATTPTITKNIANFDPNYRDYRVAFDTNKLHAEPTLRGGNNFTGSTTAADGTFIFDLTPIIEEYIHYIQPNTQYRFYIKVSDNESDSYPTILKSFKVIDRKNNITANSQVNLPLTANNSTVTAYANSAIVAEIVSENKQFNMQFSLPIQLGTLTTSNVYVKDSNNNIVAGTSLSTSVDKKTWTVSPPNGGYAKGNYYTLFIMPGMRTPGGNTLPSQQIINFYVP